ncbi:hypothetical protein N825_03605 [Skermanella stibiiresistens SB22]|uniref:Uncharacterized protein n=1 Tax=Skermanella stibiiresistens SB22 TaxID=1385369 RepID=W9H8N8_9PROT|nr:hypothetical protein [Skermanella stibiiresistens]EWY40148.1 hypothetical protein N825_03605 [Skermanella stibiiresistens SB22]
MPEAIDTNSEAVGTTRVFYELHTYHGSYWMCAKTTLDRDEAESGARNAQADKVGFGARVALCTEYADYDHVSRTILSRTLWRDGAVDVSAPLIMPVPGGDGICRTVADLRSDRARETMAAALQRYLDDNRLTPLELLHSDANALRLNDAGTTLQGALQKVAIAQVQGTDVPVQRRFKDLLALGDQVLAELRADAKRVPVKACVPGSYGAQCAALEAKHPDAAAYHILRALSLYLAEAPKGWIGKLDALGHLVEERLPARHVMPLDAILSEIANASTVTNDLTGPNPADRLTHIRSLLDLHAGRYEAPANRASDGIRALNWLIREGRCPRTRSTIERRVIRELTNIAPLKAERALWNQAQTLHLLMELFKETPPLAHDIEMLETLEQRALRLINPESVAEAIGQCKLPSEKVRTLVRIVDLMPYVASKAKMTEFVRAAWSPDDLVREGGGKDRPAALPILVGMHRDIAGAEMDPDTQAKLLTDLDATMLDIVRIDVLNAPNRTFMDRILQLMKLCAASPLPEGKARACAVDAVGRAVNSPEFLDPFLKRFKAEAERKQALLSLRSLLKSSGLAGR